MTLSIHINDVFEELLTHQANQSRSSKELIQCIDLTLLDHEASSNSLASIKEQADLHQVAAVCVYPNQLSIFNPSASYKLATVINFPHGNERLDACMTDLDKAISNGANEIDYVLSYQDWLAGEQKKTLEHCKYVIDACKKQNLTIKIILETGAYTSAEQIYQVSTEVILSGCDFLKTSTGKIPQGASLSAAFAMLSAIKDTKSTCGLKVSGGVKTPQQAINFAHLAELMLGKSIDNTWFRIGASSLLNELLKNRN